MTQQEKDKAEILADRLEIRNEVEKEYYHCSDCLAFSPPKTVKCDDLGEVWEVCRKCGSDNVYANN
jgi:ribosomal protein L40E